jgi:hypothetical protein
MPDKCGKLGEQTTVSSSFILSKSASEMMTTKSQTGLVAMRHGSERSEGRTGWDFLALGVAVIVGLAAALFAVHPLRVDVVSRTT